jgi:hypothetical protein
VKIYVKALLYKGLKGVTIRHLLLNNQDKDRTAKIANQFSKKSDINIGDRTI